MSAPVRRPALPGMRTKSRGRSAARGQSASSTASSRQGFVAPRSNVNVVYEVPIESSSGRIGSGNCEIDTNNQANTGEIEREQETAPLITPILLSSEASQKIRAVLTEGISTIVENVARDRKQLRSEDFTDEWASFADDEQSALSLPALPFQSYARAGKPGVPCHVLIYKSLPTMSVPQPAIDEDYLPEGELTALPEPHAGLSWQRAWALSSGEVDGVLSVNVAMTADHSKTLTLPRLAVFADSDSLPFPALANPVRIIQAQGLPGIPAWAAGYTKGTVLRTAAGEERRSDVPPSAQVPQMELPPGFSWQRVWVTGIEAVDGHDMHTVEEEGKKRVVHRHACVFDFEGVAEHAHVAELAQNLCEDTISSAKLRQLELQQFEREKAGIDQTSSLVMQVRQMNTSASTTDIFRLASGSLRGLMGFAPLPLLTEATLDRVLARVASEVPVSVAPIIEQDLHTVRADHILAITRGAIAEARVRDAELEAQLSILRLPEVREEHLHPHGPYCGCIAPYADSSVLSFHAQRNKVRQQMARTLLLAPAWQGATLSMRSIVHKVCVQCSQNLSLTSGIRILDLASIAPRIDPPGYSFIVRNSRHLRMSLAQIDGSTDTGVFGDLDQLLIRNAELDRGTIIDQPPLNGLVELPATVQTINAHIHQHIRQVTALLHQTWLSSLPSALQNWIHDAGIQSIYADPSPSEVEIITRVGKLVSQVVYDRVTTLVADSLQLLSRFLRQFATCRIYLPVSDVISTVPGQGQPAFFVRPPCDVAAPLIQLTLSWSTESGDDSVCDRILNALHGDATRVMTEGVELGLLKNPAYDWVGSDLLPDQAGAGTSQDPIICAAARMAELLRRAEEAEVAVVAPSGSQLKPTGERRYLVFDPTLASLPALFDSIITQAVNAPRLLTRPDAMLIETETADGFVPAEREPEQSVQDPQSEEHEYSFSSNGASDITRSTINDLSDEGFGNMDFGERPITPEGEAAEQPPMSDGAEFSESPAPPPEPSFQAYSNYPTFNAIDSSQEWIGKYRAEVAQILEKASVLPVALVNLLSEHAWLLSVTPDDVASVFGTDCFSEERMVELVIEQVGEDVNAAKRLAEQLCEPTGIPAEDEAKPVSLQEIIRELDYYHDVLLPTLSTICLPKVITGLFQIDATTVLQQIQSAATQLFEQLTDILASRTKARFSGVADCWRRALVAIDTDPSTPEIYEASRTFVRRLPSVEASIKAVLASAHEYLAALEKFGAGHKVSDLAVTMCEATCGPQKLVMRVEQFTSTTVATEHRFESMLEETRADLVKRFTELEDVVGRLSSLSDLLQTQENYEEILSVERQLQEASDTADLVASHETILGLPHTRFQYENLMKNFGLYKDLWTTAYFMHRDATIWLEGPLSELNPDDIEDAIKERTRLLLQVVRTLSPQAASQTGTDELVAISAVLPQTSSPVEAAQVHLRFLAQMGMRLPVIRALRCEGLRPRHWEQLEQVLSAEFDPSTLTLMKLMSLGIDQHSDDIAKIAFIASREHEVEKQLEKMTAAWRQIVFETIEKQLPDGLVRIVSQTDDIQQMLDEHIVTTLSLRGSPFIGPFEKRALEWEATLQKLQTTLDLFLSVQRIWLHLSPILSSPDIRRQLPTESADFIEVNSTWKMILAQTIRAGTTVMKALSREELADELSNLLARLELGEKGLEDYLESARLTFPRFHFLSNEELVDILAQARLPRAVQPHLRKCFEGLHQLVFVDMEPDSDPESPTLKAVGMRHDSGEQIDFVNPVVVVGAPPQWLLAVEDAMRASVRRAVVQTAQALGPVIDDPEARTEWMLQYPAQAVLAVEAAYWAREVEESLSVSGTAGLEELLRCLTTRLQAAVTCARGHLDPRQRTTTASFITQAVHARDVVAALYRSQTTSRQGFKWVSQLRYVFEDEDLSIRQCDAQIAYGYEYIGVTTRLVITPLTDRCMLTLTGAIHNCLGGAPEGPAGTGKTETVKDLGKAVATYTLTFNGQESLNVQAMARFMKGLALAGAWSCWDEFNRIPLSVLSVIAEYIMIVQQALRSTTHEAVLEGQAIVVRPTFATFITMNPGYAGRTELPDNLKALFRPVAMVVPDYAQIAEISLYSEGFAQARLLAQKIVKTLQLSSEQLSAQPHYDFGMRAVKTILTAAGTLRHGASGDQADEEQLALRAIRDSTLPKFADVDVPLFLAIVSDLFPGSAIPEPAHDRLKESIAKQCGELGLLCSPPFLQKVLQYYDSIVVRHGVMIVGEAFSGKSSIMNVLVRAMPEAVGVTVTCHTINPKAMTLPELYGRFDSTSGEWADGVLAATMREAAVSATPENNHWIVLDGPVDALWIENMNTVLDDNRKLCLASGEVVALTPAMRMIFEVADLAVASPATVSRCGMVYLEPALLGWASHLHHFFERDLPQQFEQFRPTIQGIFDTVEPTLTTIIDALPASQALTQITSFHCTANALRILRAILRTQVPHSAEMSENGPDEKTQRGIVTLATLFAITWGHCAPFEQPVRLAMANTIMALAVNAQLLKSTQSTLSSLLPPAAYERYQAAIEATSGTKPAVEGVPQLPSGASLIDVVPDFQTLQWSSWPDSVKTTTDGRYLAVPHLDTPALMEMLKPGESPMDVLMPTQSVTCARSLLNLLFSDGAPVLIAGPAGTGKSSLTRDYLLHGPCAVALPSQFGSEAERNWSSGILQISTSLTAGSTAGDVSDMLLTSVPKRRKLAVGPQPGVRGVFLIDDLNLPQPDEYGSFPPLEVLRTLLDIGGLHTPAHPSPQLRNAFIAVESVTVIGALRPVGGGAYAVSQRLLSKFVVVGLPSQTESELSSLFSVPLNAALTRREIALPVLNAAAECVTTGVSLFRRVSAEIRAVPEHSWYTFSVRDLSALYRSLSTVEHLESRAGIVQAFIHEAERVFGDRLADNASRKMLRAALEGANASLKGPEDVLSPETECLADVSIPLVKDVYAAAPMDDEHYDKVDFEAFESVLNERLEQFNVQEPTNPLDIVLFPAACHILARLLRVLRQPASSVLLVGNGGSGRHSLARLAVSILNMELFQITCGSNYGLAEWHDDMKKLLMRTGVDGRSVCFLISSSQMKDEWLREINTVIASGEVPGLWEPDEEQNIIESVAKAARTNTRADALSAFAHRVIQNLHIVFCASPSGSELRTILRTYPSLASCASPIYVAPWPDDARRKVARHVLTQGLNIDELSKTIVEQTTRLAEWDEATLTQVISESGLDSEHAHSVHQAARDMPTTDHAQRLADVLVSVSEQLEELGRASTAQGHTCYTTPLSFVTLCKRATELYKRLYGSVSSQYRRYAGGLQKIAQATEEVTDLQQQQQELQPVLLQTQSETERMMGELQVKRQQSQQVRDVTQVEEGKAALAAERARVMKEKCDNELMAALPALEAAEAALRDLKRADVIEVKALRNPPVGVRQVMAAVCIMLREKPAMVPDPKQVGKRIPDYWQTSQKILGDNRFLSRLIDFDRESITEQQIRSLEPYLTDPSFTPTDMERVSHAAAGLCAWIVALSNYYQVMQVVTPLRQALTEAEESLRTLESDVAQKRAQLQAVEDEINKLAAQYEEATQKRDQLQTQYKQCASRLTRATKLLSGLKENSVIWTKKEKELQLNMVCVLGDAIFAAAIEVYCGVFDSVFRDRAYQLLAELLHRASCPVSSPNQRYMSLLTTALERSEWTSRDLPSNDFTFENAALLLNSWRWPFVIDPEGQCETWIQSFYRSNGVDAVVVQPDTHDLSRSLESAIRIGTPVIMTDVVEIDTLLLPLISRTTVRHGGMDCVKVGDSLVELHPNFRLMLFTRESHPKLTAEVATAMTIINFAVTGDGLVEQLLSVAVHCERPDLETKRIELLNQMRTEGANLSAAETRILNLIEGNDNLLDDDTLVTSLEDAAQLSADISKRMVAARQAEQRITLARQEYVGLASRGVALFFTLQSMRAVRPQYQFSLAWFSALFKSVILSTQTDANAPVNARIEILLEALSVAVIQQGARGVFATDRAALDLTAALSILILAGDFSPAHIKALTQEVSSSDSDAAERPSFLQPSAWASLCSADLPLLRQVRESFNTEENVTVWKNWVLADSVAPLGSPLPVLGVSVPLGDEIILRKLLRPDHFTEIAVEALTVVVSPAAAVVPALDFSVLASQSSSVTPVMMLLDSGCDPTAALNQQATVSGVKLVSVSLGEGQGPRAMVALQQAAERGSWVLLQNLHVAGEWINELSAWVRDLHTLSTLHRGFRLWFTTLPTNDIPERLLRVCLKCVCEQAQGISAAIEQAAADLPPGAGKMTQCPDLWAELLSRLLFFHASVIERNRYGPIGWTGHYEFGSSDLLLSFAQFRAGLRDVASVGPTAWADVPFESITALTGEVNYGGRVTDNIDRRIMITLTDRILGPKRSPLPEPLHFFSQRTLADKDTLVEEIRQLPVSLPALAGLPANAAILSGLEACLRLSMLTSRALRLVQLPGKASLVDGSSGSGEVGGLQLITSLQGLLPPLPDVNQLRAKFPPSYDTPLNVVLVQEVEKYEALVSTVASQLKSLVAALKGEDILTPAREQLLSELTQGLMPKAWRNISYAMRGSAIGWLEDLRARVLFMTEWAACESIMRPSFWLGGFFFPQGFLTGILQSCARRHKVPVDELGLTCRVLNEVPKTAPSEGAVVTGLWLEGARWHDGHLADLPSGEILCQMPPLLLVVQRTVTDPTTGNQTVSLFSDESIDESIISKSPDGCEYYHCPVYRTTARYGTLSTTGHSTNFILTLPLPTTKPAADWILGGVAMLSNPTRGGDEP